jgi:hypothetical protein
MEHSHRIRTAGTSCVTGVVLWMIAFLTEYGLGLRSADTRTLFYLNQALFFVAAACWVVAIIGLIWARAAGDGWFGKFALGLFTFGWSVLTVSIPIGAITEYGNILAPIGGLISGLGALLAGIAIATARRWHGWQRWAVLFYALYYWFGMLLLGEITNQDPDLFRKIIWALAWLPIGFALISVTNRRTQPATA